MTERKSEFVAGKVAPVTLPGEYALHVSVGACATAPRDSPSRWPGTTASTATSWGRWSCGGKAAETRVGKGGFPGRES